MSRRIFISAVSRELKSYRLLVEVSLQKRGYLPVFQEIFPLTDQEIVELLRSKIAECDAVVCLVGNAYGAEPSKPLDGQPRRSFTQLEYFLGRERSLPVFLFLTTDSTPIDRPNDEADELRRLQQHYRDEVTRDRNWRSFAGYDQLRAEIAELRFPWGADPQAHRPCNLPASIGTLFKGRDDFLATLRRKLTAAVTRAAAITPRHAIHGLGGVGKTQLAVEYGWRHAGDYSALLYLYADSPEALLTNLALLTGILELPERELKEDERRAAAVLRWLDEHPGWLLLIDNVDTPEAARAVTAHLQHLHGGHVLITSRIARWSALVEPLELDVLDLDDARDYLLEAAQQRQRVPGEEAEAKLLAGDVDGLALALTQAAGYIGKYRLSFAAYRRRWHDNFAKVSDWHDARTMSYPRSLAVTWNTTVDALTPPARTLLELLSWLAPEPFPRELVTGASLAGPLAESGIAEAEEALMELADVSLTRLDGDSVELHRLVQEITRGRVPAEHQQGRLRSLLAVVDEYPLGNPTDVRIWPHWDPLAAHVAVLVDRADAAGIATPTAPLMNDLAVFLAGRIRFAEAERLYRRALAIDEHSFGPDHPKVAIRLNNLAQLLKVTNRLVDAEPLMRRALAIDEHSFGPDHPDVAIDLNNLAQLLKATNRLVDAEPLMRRALAIDEHSFGPDHPDVAIDLNNLAQLLQATNRLDEAEPLMRRALAIDEHSFGPDHPRVAIRLSNLAQLLQATNRLVDAEPLMERVVAIMEKALGADHPNVATALNNLAQLLQATNRLDEAEPLMRRALAIDEHSFGPDHPDVARDLNNLAQLLQATNRLDEAEPLMRRALAIDEHSFGPDHPDVARDLNNLAQLLKATNRLVEAEPLMRRALAIDEHSFGPDHPDVAIDLNNLAQLLQATNRLVDAEPLMRRALAIDEHSFGPEHPKVARDLNNLAVLLQATNRLVDAEPLMRRALAIDERSFGPEHPNVAIRLNNLAQLLQATNRLVDAEPLMERVVAIMEKALGADHPNVATALNNLAQLLQATNRLDEAEPLMRRALAIDEHSFGPDHPDVAIRLNNLAQLLQATNRLVDAEPLMERVVAIMEKALGADHPNVATALNNLAQLLKATNRLVEAEPLMRRALAIDEHSFGPDHPNVAIRLNNLAQLLQATNRLVEAEPLMRRALELGVDFGRRTGHEHPRLSSRIDNYRQLLAALGRGEAEIAAALGEILS